MTPAPLDIEQSNARFRSTFRKAITLFTLLLCAYLITASYVVLTDQVTPLGGWQMLTCLALSAVALGIYLAQFRMSMRMNWPPPTLYSIGLWSGFYLVTILLNLLDGRFLWHFYILFALGFGLFSGWRILLSVGVMLLTLFAFQGLLTWPFDGNALVNVVSQTLMLVSITVFHMLFQHLIRERFERNKLLSQLSEANAELEVAHQQLVNSALQQQELAVLRERTRLAREMHDTIGHALVLISVQLEAAQRLLKRDIERCHQELDSTKQVTRETMTALRASIAGLRAPALADAPLKIALKQALDTLAQRNNLKIEYHFQSGDQVLSETLEDVLWKVSQEAFTNIEKHAQANLVRVNIEQQAAQIRMSIQDDGLGIPALFQQTSPNGHYGLQGIRERVEALHGQVTLTSGTGQGTTIEIHLPIALDLPVTGTTILLVKGVSEQCN